MFQHGIDYHCSICEDEIYNCFVKYASDCRIDGDPLGFAESLTECASAHANFLSHRDRRGNDDRNLRNLALLGCALCYRRILLLASHDLAPDLFGKLCCANEKPFLLFHHNARANQIL